MVINIIVCIVSVLLMLQEASLIQRVGFLWMVHNEVIEAYDKKHMER